MATKGRFGKEKQVSISSQVGSFFIIMGIGGLMTGVVHIIPRVAQHLGHSTMALGALVIAAAIVGCLTNSDV